MKGTDRRRWESTVAGDKVADREAVAERSTEGRQPAAGCPEGVERSDSNSEAKSRPQEHEESARQDAGGERASKREAQNPSRRIK
ncbi:hypothetical protein FEM03_02290 [Phragmitibacter flavus]|uniref:Uncharacterized protein n=1 Tax=Phragmitibacter flavus TaxID=2576071 RepID=A0A5R8KIQ4_9BACT|nr:hypothetical protein [Phragmitibacter flavus]TLD72206.1 hypothetical protein FEM03_02290 [Phragmitibacter flavus]